MSTPVNFLDAFQAFLNVRESAESSQPISEISEQSVEDEDLSFTEYRNLSSNTK